MNTRSRIPSRRRRTNRSRFIASPIRRVPDPGGFGERKILKASRSGGRRCQGRPQPGEELRLKEIVTGYAPGAPKLALWLEENLSQGLTVFTLPATHQKRMRTSNALERVNQELKRRTNGIHGLWVLVPTNDQSPLPLLNNKPIPITNAAQHARLTEAWLSNRHRSGEQPMLDTDIPDVS